MPISYFYYYSHLYRELHDPITVQLLSHREINVLGSDSTEDVAESGR